MTDKEEEYKKMENKIIKAITGTPVPHKIAKLYYNIVSEQLDPDTVKKMNYKNIRELFWKDVAFDFTE